MAGNRCGYCRSLQKYVLGMLLFDHIIPKAKGGTDDPDNLWERLSAVQWLQGDSFLTQSSQKQVSEFSFSIPDNSGGQNTFNGVMMGLKSSDVQLVVELPLSRVSSAPKPTSLGMAPDPTNA